MTFTHRKSYGLILVEKGLDEINKSKGHKGKLFVNHFLSFQTQIVNV